MAKALSVASAYQPGSVQVVTTISEVRDALRPARGRGRTVGLVPTMGFLHHGHMTLAVRAKRENDMAVLSIFVNPTQFAPGEDFATYPRDLDRDLDLCARHGVDVVFAPGVGEMYPAPMETFVEVESLSNVLIGRQRPGHFRGVATVVAKLLNIVEPDRAYFGEKDFQQLAVVRRMARDLSMRTTIVGVPTVRDPDGLAASSRNARLSVRERASAAVIAHALDEAERRFLSGERDAADLLAAVRDALAGEPDVRPASVDLCDSGTLAPVTSVGDRPAVVLVTARIGDVFLIDQRELRDGQDREDRP